MFGYQYLKVDYVPENGEEAVVIVYYDVDNCIEGAYKMPDESNTVTLTGVLKETREGVVEIAKTDPIFTWAGKWLAQNFDQVLANEYNHFSGSEDEDKDEDVDIQATRH